MFEIMFRNSSRIFTKVPHATLQRNLLTDFAKRKSQRILFGAIILPIQSTRHGTLTTSQLPIVASVVSQQMD